MLIERPPFLFRALFPGAEWRLEGNAPGRNRSVFLTFDDGPDPEVTPWVLDTLARYDIPATFFMVGENVARYPDLAADVIARGHSVGNHTMHHARGLFMSAADYMADVDEAAALINSPLFRPPHGLLRPSQLRALRASGRRVIMYDLVTRDYSSRLAPRDVIKNVSRLVRPGSIIVFHDSQKAFRCLREALPASIEWLLSHGYGFLPVSMA